MHEARGMIEPRCTVFVGDNSSTDEWKGQVPHSDPRLPSDRFLRMSDGWRG